MRKIIFICCLIFLIGALYPRKSCEDRGEIKIKTEFSRDVMMPLGLPLVSFYHLIRENFFLNLRIEDENFFESLGNFFLIPSQYLFGGKTLHHDQLVPSFHYHQKDAFKSFLSCIAFPISETLGISFKALSHLSPKIRKRNHTIKKNLSHIVPQNHRYKDLFPFHCAQFIPCQGHPRPSNLLKKQKIEIAALKEIATLLNEHQILWWIDCGTCLGAYRHGGMIPWDWDIDISILLPDHQNVKNILSKLDPKKYQIQDWSSYDYPESFLKLYVKETKNFIDIYHYKIDEENKTVAYFFTFKDSPLFPESWKQIELKCTPPLAYEQLFPLKKATFDDLIVWAPHDVVGFLQSKYGEDLSPAKVWDEASQTYQKVAHHAYYQ